MEPHVMKIAVLGGSGMIGSAIVAEAVERGHDVSAVSRGDVAERLAGVTYVQGDASDATLTSTLVNTYDAVVSATVPDRAPEADHEPYLDTIANLFTPPSAAYVLVVGGFGSLLQPNGQEQRHRPGGSVAKYRREAETVARGLAYIRENQGNTQWTYVCPPIMIRPGDRTKKYVLGDDHPVGEEISSQDFAVAVLDELERPTHVGRRFTVAN
jgi:putative NADH-flavin reductase